MEINQSLVSGASAKPRARVKLTRITDAALRSVESGAGYKRGALPAVPAAESSLHFISLLDRKDNKTVFDP